ncbi:MAG: hypothetical protein CSA20_01490 [Deltaproteobacteria bacterium]|nr:MAG: hypothetical protein CSB32_00815 [Desulfobacterales bacterium]PIE73757.1 MAG: hypothetical protein CSA20_01490 [Deltaproteobacteria bacterium]
MDSGICQEFENEWYIVRYSGEIPEIAYHSSLYHLTTAEDGPRCRLSLEQLAALKEAAVERYREIILRDMLHDNYGTPQYRGVRRSIANYDRFCCFCRRQNLDIEKLRNEAADCFVDFIARETRRVIGDGMPTIINCSFPDLQCFADKLGLSLSQEQKQLRPYCPEEDPGD